MLSGALLSLQEIETISRPHRYGMEEVGCPKARCQVAALPFNDEQRQSVCTLGCPRVKSETGLYPEGRERVKKGSLSALVAGRCDKQRT